LPWLFVVYCVSKWALGLVFQSLWWMSLGFWWNCIKHVDYFWGQACFNFTCQLSNVGIS
jgi:hypothetical protein